MGKPVKSVEIEKSVFSILSAGKLSTKRKENQKVDIGQSNIFEVY
jgi:hypothetical protein